MSRWGVLKKSDAQPDGGAWCTLDRLYNGPAGKWAAAREQLHGAESAFEDLLIGNDDCTDPVLPGRDFVSVGMDDCDWDGISLEIHGYIGEPPTDAERERLWAMGFTVIRLDYKNEEEWTSQHKFHGDWWCVKGDVPHSGKPMAVGVDRCPTHYYGNGPDGQPASGQCALLFGHAGAHEHGADAKRGPEAKP